MTTFLIFANIISISVTILFCMSIQEKILWEYKRIRKDNYYIYSTIYKDISIKAGGSKQQQFWFSIEDKIFYAYKNIYQAKIAALDYVDNLVYNNLIQLRAID